MSLELIEAYFVFYDEIVVNIFLYVFNFTVQLNTSFHISYAP